MTDDDLKLVKLIQTRFRQSRDDLKDQYDEIETGNDLVAGRQWDESAERILKARKQPCVTFNRAGVLIGALTGLETLNRKEARIIPRREGPEMAGLSDLWTAAIEYVNDDNLADYHHSQAFRDMAIGGVGATLTRMDYDRNPDGDIVIEELDPRMTWWDSRAVHKNLSDTRFRGYNYALPYSEVKEQWPVESEDLKGASVFTMDSSVDQPHDAQAAPFYINNELPKARDDDYVWLCRYQWYELETFYRLSVQGEIQTLSADEYRQLKKDVPELDEATGAVKQRKRKFYQAIVAGDTLLEKTELSCEDFTIQFMTGIRDRNKKMWYGMVRSIKDPQKWLNKLYSQLLHIINANSKGGVIAEETAFPDPQQAEADWAQPDKIVFTRDGAVRNGAIMQKDPMPYPSGMDRLMQVAQEMFQGVSGANIELLGLAEKVQPGVLEAQRKQAGMTILAWAFDAMTAYRKSHTKVVAKYISKYLADGRLIRIAGDQGAQYIPLMRDQLAPEYDVIVDESASSPNEKERTFAVLMQLLPMFAKMGMTPPASFIEYCPLPQSFIEDWKKQMQPNPEQQQKQQMFEQMAVAKEQAEIENTQAETQKTAAETQQIAVETELEPLKAVM